MTSHRIDKNFPSRLNCDCFVIGTLQFISIVDYIPTRDFYYQVEPIKLRLNQLFFFFFTPNS